MAAARVLDTVVRTIVSTTCPGQQNVPAALRHGVDFVIGEPQSPWNIAPAALDAMGQEWAERLS